MPQPEFIFLYLLTCTYVYLVLSLLMGYLAQVILETIQVCEITHYLQGDTFLSLGTRGPKKAVRA